MAVSFCKMALTNLIMINHKLEMILGDNVLQAHPFSAVKVCMYEWIKCSADSISFQQVDYDCMNHEIRIEV